MMGRHAARQALGVTVAALATGLLTATPAAANGYCGQNFDGNHACAVNTASASDYSGSILTDNEQDYYVFHAAKGTQLSVSLTDTENPGCSQWDFTGYCGEVDVNLYDGKGNEVDGPADSTPNNGVTVPGAFAHTIDATGTYFLIVEGSLGSDANDNPTSVPYTMHLTASPNVQWPPPPPPPPPTTHHAKHHKKHHHRHHHRHRH